MKRAARPETVIASFAEAMVRSLGKVFVGVAGRAS